MASLPARPAVQVGARRSLPARRALPPAVPATRRTPFRRAARRDRETREAVRRHARSCRRRPARGPRSRRPSPARFAAGTRSSAFKRALSATAAAPAPRSAVRMEGRVTLDGSGGLSQDSEDVRSDRGEGRRRDLGAVRLPLGLVHDDRDHDARPVGGGEPDEGGDVTVLRIACARHRLLRRARLARGCVARNRGCFSRSHLDDPPEEDPQPACRVLAHEAPRSRPLDSSIRRIRAPIRIPDRIHEVDRRQHAAVRDRGVRARHLEHGDSDFLAERHRRQRERAPARCVREEAGGLPFQLDARLLSESERPDRLVERGAAERHRDVRDPDVRGMREDVPDGQRAPAFSAVLVNRVRPDRERASPAVDRVVERDGPGVERGRGRHDLERRAGLVNVCERPAAPRLRLHVAVAVRIERGERGERENRARGRIENDSGGSACVEFRHDLRRARARPRAGWTSGA